MVMLFVFDEGDQPWLASTDGDDPRETLEGIRLLRPLTANELGRLPLDPAETSTPAAGVTAPRPRRPRPRREATPAPPPSPMAAPGADLDPGAPDLLTVDELALLLRVNRKTVYSAIAAGEIPGVRRVGKSLRVSRAAVLQSFADGTGGRPGRRSGRAARKSCP